MTMLSVRSKEVDASTLVSSNEDARWIYIPPAEAAPVLFSELVDVVAEGKMVYTLRCFLTDGGARL